MKKLYTAAMLALLSLTFTSAAVAEGVVDRNKNVNQQFMGQRPYQVAPAADETYRADDQWVGTGITSEESVESKNAKIKANDNVRQLRLHSLGKRAYIETPTVD